MKISKTFVAQEGTGNIFICDTISYKEKLWLVPFWFENRSEKYKFPARIIRMDNLRYQKAPPNYPADYVLSDPAPKYVLDHLCPIPKDTLFEIEDAPDLRIPTLSEDYNA